MDTYLVCLAFFSFILFYNKQQFIVVTLLLLICYQKLLSFFCFSITFFSTQFRKRAFNSLVWFNFPFYVVNILNSLKFSVTHHLQCDSPKQIDSPQNFTPQKISLILNFVWFIHDSVSHPNRCDSECYDSS